ncbi:diguanylate cyclase [Blastococcus sp. URHD0036]|uniref:GGDEF domain-containing protein n=1 Tax=Blastococcus sp. URHD0036 TaxID=1380356 RepID=UPI00068C8E48|nr:GGDEF domain-containing protein [Blastococcus sp. URHD0036]
MPTSVVRRLVGALLAGDQPAGDDGRALDRPGSDPGSEAEVAAQWLRRARASGIVIGLVAVTVWPVWALLDRYLEPHLAGQFLLVRALAEIPMLICLYLLWRSDLGRRRPEALTFVILAVVQLSVCWMVAQVHETESYASGLSLAIYGCGGVLAAQVRWTVALTATTWAALGAAIALSPVGIPDGDIAAIVFWLATASVVATVTHAVRHTLGSRELSTRVHLLRERERTRLLLDRLERLSLEDPLTGLANRRRWDAELAAACEVAGSGGAPIAVVVIDVDHFKQVNDRHGHAGGDAALREVARLLIRRVRSGDLVARLGGDELAVLMPGSDAERATELAEALRGAVASLVPPGFAPGELTLSLGVAAGEGLAPAELMARADERLYAAKATRNAVGAPLPRPRTADRAAPAR